MPILNSRPYLPIAKDRRKPPRKCTALTSLTALVAWASVLFCSSHHMNAQELKGFGSGESRPKALGFGRYAELWPKVTDADSSQSKGWMKQYDKNGSGVLESQETATWSAESHRSYDLNSDGKMRLDELTMGIALLRLQKEFAAKEKARLAAEQAKKKAAKEQPQPPKPAPFVPTLRVDPAFVARQAMCTGLAGELIGQFDKNGNGQLEHPEWKSSGQRFADFSGGADNNGDKIIVIQELSAWLLRRMGPLATTRLARPLQVLDRDGDGQITMPEFATPPNEEKFHQFRSLDQNDDGLISPEESHTAPVPFGTIGFASDIPRVLNGKGTAVSNIWIDDDVDIRDIDVRVAITKPNDHQLQLYLVGPDSTQVTLFVGGWQPWDGSLFESTLIDDEATFIDKKLPRAPFPRILRTDGLRKEDEPSLKSFYGKSGHGTWRLLVVNIDDNVGVLHHWSLWIKPQK